MFTRKVVGLLLMLFMAFSGFFPFRSIAAPTAQELYVSTSGNNNNDCLTSATACRTILYAIAKALHGDTINIAVGAYFENLQITKNVTLKGTDRNLTIIDGNQQDRVIHNAATITISNLTIRNGKAFLGAGIYNTPTGDLTLRDVVITGNSVGNGGGGGLYNSSGKIFITTTTISYNQAGIGGGLMNEGTAFILDSTFHNNTATTSGAIRNHSQMLIQNSTISTNSSTNQGGGISNSGSVDIYYSTLAYNTAPEGSNLFDDTSFNYPFNVYNTIIHGTGDNCSGDITSLGYNIDNNNTCGMVGGTFDLKGVDPKIGPLQFNGGPTKTHALLVKSPAIDSGSNEGCHVADQRDMLRPQGTTCDRGSFEVERIVVWVHGFQGFANKQFSVSMGAVRYDPNEPKDIAFVPMIDWIHQDGFPIWMVHYETGPDGSYSILADIVALQHQLTYIRSVHTGSHITIIGHSLGGVIARLYLSSPSYVERDIENLITLGSPHQGLEDYPYYANLCQYINYADCNLQDQISFSDLLFRIKALNDKYSVLPQGLNTYLIGGDILGTDNTELAGAYLAEQIGEGNDGLVTVNSAWGVNNVTARIITHESHTELFGPETYYGYRRNSMLSDSYYCITLILHGEQCGAAINGLTKQETSSQTTSAIPIGEEMIDVGEIVAHTISVDSGPTMISTSWLTGSLNVHLISPSGTMIDPSYAQSYPEEVRYFTSRPEDTPAILYVMNNAEGGEWKVIIEGNNATPYITGSIVQSDINPIINLSTNQHTVGDTIHLTVSVTETATLSSTLYTIKQPDGTIFTTTSSALFLEQEGGYYIRAIIEGIINGKPFKRFTATFVEAINKGVYLPLIIR